MTQDKEKKAAGTKPGGAKKLKKRPDQWELLNPHAAGIDVGAAEHWVCTNADDANAIRPFGANTADLEALADWLQANGITTVALESTGVYWIALFELLERRGFRVILVDPRTMPRSGRPKTDIHDCQWIQRLHRCGLLSGAFRPADHVVVLRSYVRQRSRLIVEAARYIQHMQKALTQMNVKLQQVLSNVAGVTGLAIIKSILAGQRDPHELAKLRDRRCREDEAAIAAALHGNWREDHLFELQQALELYEFHQQKVCECDVRIEAYLKGMEQRTTVPPSGAPKPRCQRRARHHRQQPHFDGRLLLFAVAGVDLTVIEGIEESTALVVLSEIGLDMSRWPSEKDFASWLCLCPNHKITGGKVYSRRTRPSANRAATALRLAANALHSSKSALGAQFRRLKARLGAPKAITAMAHKLARLIYALLKHGTAYVAQGMAEYEAQYRDRVVKNLSRKAKELGFALVPQATPVVEGVPA